VTESGAHTAANLVVAAMGVAAAYVVLTTPPLRRLAIRGVRVWLGASVPIYLARQVRQAWMESARAA
jgi:hypothetical protein